LEAASNRPDRGWGNLTTDDTLLTNFIEFASARFERDTNRLLERTANITEEFPGGQTKILVARYPLESVAPFNLKSCYGYNRKCYG